LIFVERLDSERGGLASRVEEITQHFGEVSIVGIAEPSDSRIGIDAVRLGLKGCVLTSQHIEVAIAAIRLVLAGGSYVPSELIESICDSFDVTSDGVEFPECGDRLSYSVLSDRVSASASRISPDLGLTGRESEIIEQLRQGKPNKIIAYELRISEGTVKVHMRNIMRKLRATNRTQVAYLARASTAPQAPPPPLDRNPLPSEHATMRSPA
jgi:DNA-binding NarL/FixJ family response regulator